MPAILIEDLTDEEKRQADVAKAEAGSKTWRLFFLELLKHNKKMKVRLERGP